MNIFDLYETNLEKEEKGIPVELGEATVFIASANPTGNKRMAKAQAQLKRNPNGTEEDDIEYVKRLYSECVLVGWKNVKDKDGKELPYSKENAKMLFDKLPHFLDKVISVSTNLKNFQDKEIEDIQKN